MKILAKIDPNSGSDYHRLKVPLSYLNTVFVSEFTQEIIETVKPDVLWIRKNCGIKAVTFALWKSMFGVKIVFDMDDSWVIPKNHPNFQQLQKHENAKDLCLLADHVVVSTKELIAEVIPYNKATVIPNRIPYGQLQFIEKKETFNQFNSRKIKVGLIGSFYHYEDYKEIKGWLQTLVLNPLFKEKCEFIICGYSDSAHKYWVEFAHLGKFAKSMTTDTYIKLYNELDIILCPLQDNQLNKAKSSLKILEAAVSNSVCVLDSLYESKTDTIQNPYHFYVKKEKEWCSLVLDLIKDKDRLWTLKNWSGVITRRLKFEEVIDQRKQVLNIPIKEEKDLNIYTIKYQENQPCEYKEYFNKVNSIEQKSYLFEYNAILDIISKIENNADWVGIFSWKFPLKTHLFKKKVQLILERNQNYDCINFSKPLGQPYLKFTETQHPGFMNLFSKICKDLNLPTKEPSSTVYSNFFVLKTSLYKEYIELLKQAIHLLETKYKEDAWRNANYKAGLSSDQLKQFTELEYYTFHTFILERLVGQWLDKQKIKTLNYFK